MGSNPRTKRNAKLETRDTDYCIFKVPVAYAL